MQVGRRGSCPLIGSRHRPLVVYILPQLFLCIHSMLFGASSLSPLRTFVVSTMSEAAKAPSAVTEAAAQSATLPSPAASDPAPPPTSTPPTAPVT